MNEGGAKNMLATGIGAEERIKRLNTMDPPIVYIFSEDQVWAALCAAHLAARGATALTGRLLHGGELGLGHRDPVWLIVDFDTYRPQDEMDLATARSLLKPFAHRMVAVVAAGWPKAALQQLPVPVGECVMRNPDMRILVPNLLGALDALGFHMPQSRQGGINRTGLYG